MIISQQKVEAILSDNTKTISEDIEWNADDDHSPAQEFRVEVDTIFGYPLFLNGWYNPLSGKLSYTIIHRGVGRIYSLDLGSDHRNPDGKRVGEKHKHRWKGGSRDKVAYVPGDITAPWCRPVEAWKQFCAEANLSHSGIMSPPQVQGRFQL